MVAPPTATQSDNQLILDLRAAFHDLRDSVRTQDLAIKDIQANQATQEIKLLETIDQRMMTNINNNNQTLLNAMAQQNAAQLTALFAQFLQTKSPNTDPDNSK